MNLVNAFFTPSSLSRAAASALLLGFSVSGCGDLADEHTPPKTLAVIRGQLDSVKPSSQGRVAMALFWDSRAYAQGVALAPEDVDQSEPELADPCKDANVDKKYLDGRPWGSQTICAEINPYSDALSEVVSYDPVFPLSFTVPVTTLPPDEARVDLTRSGGTGTFAMGSVMAFVDANGNGHFDFGKPGTQPEEVLAATLTAHQENDGTGAFSNVWIIYLDGKINVDKSIAPYREALSKIPQGFSIWYRKETPAENPADHPLRERKILPISEPIELLGDDKLADNAEFCSSYTLTIQYVDKPLEQNFGAWFCEENGLQVTDREDWTAQGKCLYNAEGVGMNISALKPADYPKDWPCEIE